MAEAGEEAVVPAVPTPDPEVATGVRREVAPVVAAARERAAGGPLLLGEGQATGAGARAAVVAQVVGGQAALAPAGAIVAAGT